MKKKILLVLLGMFTLVACKKMQVSYPVSTNYGENIFLLPSGIPENPTKVDKGESYNLKANLTKKASLRVVFTNISASETPKDRWLFNNKVGWYADNFVNGIQEFSSTTIGDNSLNMVFQGDSGTVRIDVYENGSAVPADVKYLYWE